MSGVSENVKGSNGMEEFKRKKAWRGSELGTWIDTSGLEVLPPPPSSPWFGADMINQSQMCIGCMQRVAEPWRGLTFHDSNCPRRIVRVRGAGRSRGVQRGTGGVLPRRSLYSPDLLSLSWSFSSWMTVIYHSLLQSNNETL